MDDAVQHMNDLSGWTKVFPGGEMPEDVELQREGDDVLRVNKHGDVSGICGWSSPFFDVLPGQYYRLKMDCNSNAFGFWEAQFFEEGADAPTDFYTNGYPDTCGSITEVEGFFYGKRCTQKCRLLLWPGTDGWAEFTGIEFDVAPKEDARDWFHNIMATTQHAVRDAEMPVIRPEKLEKVKRKLARGGDAKPVDIVIYGDSVGFDVANLPLDVYLERAYPGATVRLFTRGKGAAGWDHLGEPDVLEERVIRLDPDLVICQGVSTEPPVIEEALPDMIGGIRAGTDATVLLMTDHRSAGVVEDDKGSEYWDSCARATREAGAEKSCPVADFRRTMKSILEQARPPADRLRWFMRDSVCHLNDRGRTVVLRLLMKALVSEGALNQGLCDRGGR